MRYNKLGNTGMEASIIGLGAEHLDGLDYETVKETVDASLEYGINFMDVFMPGHDIRHKIGKAIGGSRDKFIIQGHIGSVESKKQQYDISRDLNTNKEFFRNLLIDLDTDYIDFGMLFFIDSEQHFDEVFNSDIVKYAEQLKRDGTIRAIGASSHNPIIAKKIVETGIVELLMFSVNPAFDMVPPNNDIEGIFSIVDAGFDKDSGIKADPHRQDLYKTCSTLNIPIVSMKTYGGGKLLSQAQTPFSKPLTASQCIHYALTRPAVASAMTGLKSRSEVEQAIKYLDASQEDLDYTSAIGDMERGFKGSCVYCNHCLPCPAGIDIAAVTKYLDVAEMDSTSVNKGVGGHYKGLMAHASSCIECGNCEKKCPFFVPVIENMRKAAHIFGF